MGTDAPDTPEEGNISIDVSPGEMYTKIQIRDTGKGIASGHYNDIFKRFYRSRKEQSAGVGLGLSVAKAIMEGQGGTIGVQRGTERGTKFMLSFLTKS